MSISQGFEDVKIDGPVTLVYADAVNLFNDPDVRTDLRESSTNLAKGIQDIVLGFDALRDHFHQVNVLRLNAVSPFEPRWESLRHDFIGLVWRSRDAAAIISAVLKMFLNTTIEVVTSPHDLELEDKIQFAREFVQELRGRAEVVEGPPGDLNTFISQLADFHADLKLFANKHDGNQLLQASEKKISDLKARITWLYTNTAKAASTEVTSLAIGFVNLAHATQATTRSVVVAPKGVVKYLSKSSTESGTDINRVYSKLAEVRIQLSDAERDITELNTNHQALKVTRNALSKLVDEQMEIIVIGLGFFNSIWVNLRGDVQNILTWLEKSKQGAAEPPPVIQTFSATGKTLYGPLLIFLDQFSVLVRQ